MIKLNLKSTFFLLVVGLYATNVVSQIYPDTIYVPVTFYDFHSDGSCPDFNPISAKDPPTLNMVQNDLDSDGRPVRGAVTFYSRYIENWYRSSEDGEQTVTDKEPNYSNTGAFLSENTVTGWNPYENRKIPSTLAFWHIGNGTTIPLGTYQFVDSTFFPLDGLGFGNEPTWDWVGLNQYTDHNYSFTMMMEKEFIYRDSMVFSFLGDDDVWVFINNKLALDIGGIHVSAAGSFNLDDIAASLGLVLGEKYTLSFFYAERQCNASLITITTNIISAPPESLHIDVEPSDTMYVGDTLIATSTIYTDTGAVSISDLDGELEWFWLDLNGLNHDSTFTMLDDTTLCFIPTEAYTTIKIWATYEDTVNNIFINDTVEIVVLPGPPDHLVIEASPDMPTDETLYDDNPLDTVYILGSESYNDQFYAILRDKYGNWIGPANPVDWSSADVSIVTAEPGDNLAQGQGKAIRATSAMSAATDVTGEYDYQGTILSDDLVVKIISKTFDVISAAYLETDARPDGYIDLVKVIVDDSLELTEDMLDKLFTTVTLPPHRFFSYTEDDFILTGDGFGIKVTQDQTNVPIPNTAVDASDILHIALTEFTDIGAILNTELSIEDSLAPVVYKGILYPAFIKVDYDTLEVYFSEEIEQPTNTSPFLFCNQTDVTDEYDMELQLMSTSTSDIMKFLVLSSEKEYPETGDSIWIENDGEIEDITDLVQDKDTKPAPLIVISYTYTVIEAYYKDADGNGGIDMAEVTLDGQPQDFPEKIAFTNPFVTSVTDTVTTSNMAWLNNDPATLTIVATLVNPFPYSGSTNFDRDYFGLVIAENFSEDPFKIGDKVSPVIDNATYCPGKILNKKTGERAHDTLVVGFSEEVYDVNYFRPFHLITVDRIIYHLELTQMGSGFTRFEFKVNAIVGVDYPVKGDSIWIDTTSNISDKLNNIQKVYDNRRVELIVKDKPFQLVITVLGPVDPFENPIPDEIISENNTNPITNGSVVIMDPVIDFSLTELERMDCKVQIFDAVGNLIAQSNHLRDYSNDIIQTDIVEINGRNKIVLIWSGHNTLYREVEGASYLARLYVTSPIYGDNPIIRNVLIPLKQ